MRRACTSLLIVAFASEGCASPCATAPAAAAPAREVGPHLVLAEAASQPGAPSAGNATPLPATLDGGSNGVARGLGWFSIAVGTIAGGIALGTSAMMLHESSRRDADCSAAKVCSSDGLDANSKIASLSPWNIGGYVVAAAGLGLGAFLVLTNPPENHGHVAIGVAPTGSGAGLAIRGDYGW